MLLRAQHIQKAFRDQAGTDLRALQDMSLDIGEGEFVSIVGPSGCGKSTFLRIVAGLLHPTEGEVVFQTDLKPGQLRTAMVFQEQALFPWMTVEKNISLGQKKPSDDYQSRMKRMIENIGLSEFRNHYPHQLSGGLRQRAALARAFLASPQVILMDEPFGSLDSQTRLVLQEELLRIWSENQVTIVFVTHDIDEAILLSDRVVVMSYRPGRILDEIHIPFARPRHLDLQQDPQYFAIKTKVWTHLQTEVRQSIGNSHAPVDEDE